MKLIRLSIIILVSAFIFAATGCGLHDGHKDASSQAAKEVEKPDGSTVAVSTNTDGTKTEVRTFKSGDVARVTRTTAPGGKRTASVEMRDGRKADLNDEGDIEKVMDATGDFIATAASKTWDTTKTIGKEVGDKAEDAAGKTVDVGKKVASGTKDVASEAADKAEDAGDKIGKGVKKAGKGAKRLGQKIKDKVD